VINVKICGMVVNTVASQQEGSRFDSRLEPFCVELVWVLSGYFGFLPHPKNMHVRLIGDSKLSLGVQPLGSMSQFNSSAGPSVKHVPNQ